MSNPSKRPIASRGGKPLSGLANVPGDKSISHRALMFGALTAGRTEISGLLTGEDVLATAAAFRAMGATIETGDDGVWRVDGVGIGGLTEPADLLDMGNSGTAARLLLGVLAGHGMTAFMTGDASLRSRPMKRVITPLEQMGAIFTCRSGGRLPLAITGRVEPMPIRYDLPVASAQVKSAVLLAGLAARGATTVIEHAPTRDHTENMLRHFGAVVEVEEAQDGGRIVTVQGQPELTAAPISVPSDPSSAAFPMVAAALVDGSDVSLPGICLNPTRTGLMTCLQEMGADLAIGNERVEGGEPVGDIVIRAGSLKGVEVPPDRAPSMIDEYPILAVAAAQAEGETLMTGIGELRVKESDRLAAVVAGLRANGVTVADGEDWMKITGTGGAIPGGGVVETHFDHRIAMSFLIMGLAARKPVTVDDGSAIATSFPDFLNIMTGLGADMGDA
ncbi:MAG: 3-phosphoshikimate 1-carboxyvinyltransferase [Alphaproteobacteria bacterium]